MILLNPASKITMNRDDREFKINNDVVTLLQKDEADYIIYEIVLAQYSYENMESYSMFSVYIHPKVRSQ